ncbi:MAG: dockerin type I domain-containing protein [Planctomycetota bacterium]
MTWKSILSVAAVAATSASVAFAQPTIDVSGVENAGNIDWTVTISPASPFSSVALELALETDGDILAAPVVNTTNFQENITGTDIINPGNDPFVGTVSEGVQFYEGVSSVVSNGPGGTVDGFFAPLGSTAFTTGGPFEALTFSTAGTAETTVYFDFLGAQGGTLFASVADTATAGGAPVVPGDANGDGQVDPADAAILGSNWLMNVAGGAADGDFNGDGFVDPADAAILGGNWLFGVPGSATAAPEPTTAALLALGCFAGFGRRRG